jgi:hypothetical protein
MIPLLPPLVEFMDPRSLCHYSSTSKTLQKDVRDTKAWELLAKAQLPRKTRDAASDALTRVQSHVRRRLLADAMALETPQPQTFRPNQIEDFTFFVRFEEDASPTRAAPCHRDRYRRRASPSPTPTRPPPRGRVVWEGDLRCDPTVDGFADGFISFDLRPVWDAIRRAESWPGMERILKNHVDFGSVDANVNYLQRCKITVIAIRDQDDAMVSLGQFIFDNPLSSIGDADQQYDFRSRATLFSSERFNLRMMATLEAVHNAEGHGGLDALVLRLEQSPATPLSTCDESQFAYLLSYLAGIHHLARESALATIENWHVEAMRIQSV